MLRQRVFAVFRRAGFRRQVDLADPTVVPRGKGECQASSASASRGAAATAHGAAWTELARPRARPRSKPRHRQRQAGMARTRADIRACYAAVSPPCTPRPSAAWVRFRARAWRAATHQSKTAANQGSGRDAQFHRQVQRQIVGVVQNVAKPRAVVERDVVRVVQFAPAPAQPRLLRYQVKHVGPECAAAAAFLPAGHASPDIGSRHSGKASSI